MVNLGIYHMSIVDRHSRLATLLHKLADALNSDGRAVNITEKPRPLSLTSGAISDVEISKVTACIVLQCWLVLLYVPCGLWDCKNRAPSVPGQRS